MAEVMEMLEARVTALSEYFKSDEPKILKFELKNSSDQDLYVLKWYTPLEGLISNCLKVWRDNEYVEYDGPLFKRGRPGAQDYVFIKAGETVSNNFNLDEAYSTSSVGRYRVDLNIEIKDFFIPGSEADFIKYLKVESNAGGRDVFTAGSEDAPIKNFKNEDIPDQVMSLNGDSTNFTVVEGEGAPLLTAGEISRGPSSEAKLKSAAPLVGTAKEPTFVGGTATQKAEVKKAHFDGYKLCTDALDGLANDADYVEWFGVHTAARFDIVKQTFSKVKSRMESTVFEYQLDPGPSCRDNTYAYTHSGDTKIYLCALFWSAPATGTDSKAGTVLHEHTHASASTDDLAYGQTNCRALARSKPDDAIKNADNYEYYSGG
jgi:hypothetical protein